MNPAYPFQISDDDGEYSIQAAIEDEELYPKYVEFFEEHGYTGNGYTWEGHITQILEKEAPDLLDEIDFDPEAGGFFAYTDSGEAQARFVEILSPIFSDLDKLKQHVLAADRDRIDD